MEKVHVGTKIPWHAITQAVERTKRSKNERVIAAVAFLGDDAPKFLPLGKGDLLITNAHPKTIKAGATSPKALRAYQRRGVEIHSLTGLHAKVVVLPTRCFIGSANASRSSNNFVEAVLETTDATTRKTLRDEVIGMMSSPLTRSKVAHLETLAPTRRHRQLEPAHSDTVPSDLKEIHFMNWPYGSVEWDHETQRAYEREASSARQWARSMVANSAFDAIEIPAADVGGLKEGDWVCGPFDDAGDVLPPSVFVDCSTPAGGKALAFFARPKQEFATVDSRSLLDYLKAQRIDTNPSVIRITGDRVRDVVGFFQTPNQQLGRDA